MTLDRIAADDPRLADVLALIRRSFAYMDGIIDPPSSVHKMTLESLQASCTTAEVWAGPLACMVLTPMENTLYLGKLAVDETARKRGLARIMVTHAVKRAQVHKLPSITLQTRVELTANQAMFQALGFDEIARGAHAGYNQPTKITYHRDI